MSNIFGADGYEVNGPRGPRGYITQRKFTAVQGQKTFNLPAANMSGQILVFLNGAIQDSPDDYTLGADGKSFTFVNALTAGAKVKVVVIQSVSDLLDGTIGTAAGAVLTPNGDDSFTLPWIVRSKEELLVFRDGVGVATNEFSLEGVGDRIRLDAKVIPGAKLFVVRNRLVNVTGVDLNFNFTQAERDKLSRLKGGNLFEYMWHNGPRAEIGEGFVACDGQAISALMYPDACSKIFASKQNVVSEAVWQADPTKRNCWSMGDGSGWVRTPDLNAVQAGTGKPFYLRGGTDALNGTSVGDAIRNITGSFRIGFNYGEQVYAESGAFVSSVSGLISTNTGTSVTGNNRANFDASRVVPTADENRVKTAYGVWCVRVFTDYQNGGSLDASQIATQLGVVDAKVQALDTATGFTIIYPNGGTAAAPANVAVNSRYVMANPFPGFAVIATVELRINGVWGDPKLILGTNGSYGTAVSQNGDNIVVQTGQIAMCTSDAAQAGHGFGTLAGHVTAPVPCRVKVWKLKGVQ